MKLITAQELHEQPTGTVVLHAWNANMLFAFKLKSERTDNEDGSVEYVFQIAHLDFTARDPDLGTSSFVPTLTHAPIKGSDTMTFVLVAEADIQTYMDWFMVRARQPPNGARELVKAQGDIFVDDWLAQTPMYTDEDEKILNYVHFMLNHFRHSATWQIAHREFMAPYKLFVTYEGKRWRVTGASRMGDIYLQSKFDKDVAYDKRVALNFNKLTDWGKEP
jgi:hypothetical protein